MSAIPDSRAPLRQERQAQPGEQYAPCDRIPDVAAPRRSNTEPYGDDRNQHAPAERPLAEEPHTVPCHLDKSNHDLSLRSAPCDEPRFVDDFLDFDESLSVLDAA